MIDLLGKPISECSAFCVPTAGHPMENGPDVMWRLIHGDTRNPFCDLGWKSMGVLELTALPSIDREVWVSNLQSVDALLVGGGDPLYLAYWMQQSGVAELLPSLSELVYVGFSAGSMIMAPRIGEDFARWRPPSGSDETLGFIDFSIFPHLDNEFLPENTLADATEWARKLNAPCYAIDDESAIKVVDSHVEVITEGHWNYFTDSL